MGLPASISKEKNNKKKNIYRENIERTAAMTVYVRLMIFSSGVSAAAVRVVRARNVNICFGKVSFLHGGKEKKKKKNRHK